MNEHDIEILQSGDIEKSLEIFKDFIDKYSKIFDIKLMDEIEQCSKLWTVTFNLLKCDKNQNLYPVLLSTIRILSRGDETHLNKIITYEQFNYLLDIANIGKNDLIITNNNKCSKSNNIRIEALKCLCNLVFQSKKCQDMCLNNGSIDGIINRLRLAKEFDLDYDIQYFDMKLLFLITALNVNTRKEASDMGLIDLIDLLNLHLHKIYLNELNEIEINSNLLLSNEQIDILCEILKVVFNLTLQSEDANCLANDENQELQYRRLTIILRTLLLCKCNSAEKLNELHSNAINLLTNIPINCYSELTISANECTNNEFDDFLQNLSRIKYTLTKEFDGRIVMAIDVLLNFLKLRLDNVQKLTAQQELLSPILTVLIKCVRCNSLQRRYIRTVILPPLRDVHNRPEVGQELRNHLCRLLTTPATQVRDLTAELLFVICKENVSRMIKHIGYGNAAGLFANRGLLAGGSGSTGNNNNNTTTNSLSSNANKYSSDSEDSDTEEYKKMQHEINPVLGCYEPPRPNPFDGMTEEQKEYEAMKLVKLMEQLNRQGVVQPCRIGADGRPEPVDHILELQEGIPQQVDSKNKI